VLCAALGSCLSVLRYAALLGMLDSTGVYWSLLARTPFSPQTAPLRLTNAHHGKQLAGDEVNHVLTSSIGP
jgi:hypothetical protein